MNITLSVAHQIFAKLISNCSFFPQERRETKGTGKVKLLYFHFKNKNFNNCPESVLAEIRQLVFISKGIQRYFS
jgi:hypothetical protein